MDQIRTPSDPAQREDERLHPRVQIDVKVDLFTEHNFYTGLGGDISEGGLFFATHVPPPVGTHVKVAISLLDVVAPLHVDGVVRWIRSIAASCEGLPPGCGIAWSELPEGDRANIARFVETREPILFET